VDVLPVAGQVFARPEDAEAFCRQWTARLEPLELMELADCQVELVVRQALAGPVEGLGMTAYVSSEGRDHSEAARRLTAALMALQQTIPAAEAT
jgi:hypothetical protein